MSNDTWDRRSFIAGSMSAAAVMATIAKGSTLKSAGSSISVVLYDPRYSDCRAFAAVLASAGAMPIALQDDIGRLWIDSLNAFFRATHGAIAGMTHHSDFFISKSFAREVVRSRTLFEAHHDSRDAASMMHTLEITPGERRLCADLAAAGSAWPGCLAQRLAQMQFRLARTTRDIAQGGIAAADNPGSLFSWVIAKAAS